jgi:predicted anti-sigma-YlaC factor YlaD
MIYYTYGGIACDQVIRAVWDFLDGEIDGAKKRQIVTHLELCEQCRDQYAFERSFLRAVGRLLERDDEAASRTDRIAKHDVSKTK